MKVAPEYNVVHGITTISYRTQRLDNPNSPDGGSYGGKGLMEGREGGREGNMSAEWTDRVRRAEEIERRVRGGWRGKGQGKES